MSAKRSKTVKVARKAKKKTPAKMKTKKRPAKEKPEKSAAVSEEEDIQEVDVAVLEAEPKTRLDLIRSRHNVMKKEIDQIRVALEEERDD